MLYLFNEVSLVCPIDLPLTAERDDNTFRKDPRSLSTLRSWSSVSDRRSYWDVQPALPSFLFLIYECHLGHCPVNLLVAYLFFLVHVNCGTRETKRHGRKIKCHCAMRGYLKKSCSGFSLKSVTCDCLLEFNTYRTCPITLSGILSSLLQISISTGSKACSGAKALTFSASILVYCFFALAENSVIYTSYCC